MENINAWLESLADGTVVKFRKSLPIPNEDPSRPVRTLVGKNFDKNVTGRNAVIMFFGCEHCQALAPVCEQLGALIKQNGLDVLVGKIEVFGNALDIEIIEIPSHHLPCCKRCHS